MFGFRNNVIINLRSNMAADIEGRKKTIQVPPHLSLYYLLTNKIEFPLRNNLKSLLSFVKFL